MKILIVEDDSYKLSRVSALLSEIFCGSHLVHCDSVYGAVTHLRKNDPDLIILDMSLPSHSVVAGEGSPLSMPAGGIEVIMELKILGKISTQIVILTQYPDVEIEYEYYSIEDSREIISKLYDIKSIAVIHYDNDSDEWSFRLKEIFSRP